MQIVLALLFGAVVGLLVHGTLPARDTRGVALAPMVGAAVGGLVWMALTWQGLKVSNGWLWIASLAVPLVVVYAFVPVLSRVRRRHDAREKTLLKLG